MCQSLQAVLAQSIQTGVYQGTQIVCTFSVVELDGDLFQSLINAAAVALLDSTLKCRCLPVAICIL